MLTGYTGLFIYCIPNHHRRHCLEITRIGLDPEIILIYMSCKTGINTDTNYDTQRRVWRTGLIS